MDLVFPPEDDWLLDYMFEDGVQCEPTHYVPIIPYSLLETSTTTGAGWQIKVWARNFEWVMHNLRLMIRYDYPRRNEAGKVIGEPYSMMNKVWLPNNMKSIYGITPHGLKASEICLGSYHILQCGELEQVIVTQLPIRIWSKTYKCGLLGLDPITERSEDKDGNPYPHKDLVLKVTDETGNDQNHIIITLKPGSIEKINAEYGTDMIDPIEDYLGLYQVMTPQLNMIGREGNIIEFASYEDIMRYWFVDRKNLYIKRLERQVALLKLRIMFNEEILRFIALEQENKINIDVNLEEPERILILEENKFIKFNKGVLFKPLYLKVAELSRILEEGNYSYIDDITVRMKSKKAVLELKEETQRMRDYLAKLAAMTWQILWNRDLDELERVKKLGETTNWHYVVKKHTFVKSK
jgi:hypothetical protein